jgi:hypothetical protein
MVGPWRLERQTPTMSGKHSTINSLSMRHRIDNIIYPDADA